MQIKLKDIIDSEVALSELLKIKFPIKISFKLKRLVDKIAPETKLFYEKRMELFKEYGEELEKDTWTVKPENRIKFNEEIIKLLDIDITLDNIEKIDTKEIEGCNIEPMYLISWLFD